MIRLRSVARVGNTNRQELNITIIFTLSCRKRAPFSREEIPRIPQLASHEARELSSLTSLENLLDSSREHAMRDKILSNTDVLERRTDLRDATRMHADVESVSCRGVQVFLVGSSKCGGLYDTSKALFRVKRL